MEPLPAKLNVAFCRGEIKSFLSFPFSFHFHILFSRSAKFSFAAGAWPLLFPCSWSKHKILEFLRVSASLGVCVVCLCATSFLHNSSLLACAALILDVVLDAFYSQPAPVLCVKLLLKAVRCLCASSCLSRSQNKLVGDKSAERGNKCSHYVLW